MRGVFKNLIHMEKQIVETSFGKFPLLGYITSHLTRTRTMKKKPTRIYAVIVDDNGEKMRLTPEWVKNMSQLKSITA